MSTVNADERFIIRALVYGWAIPLHEYLDITIEDAEQACAAYKEAATEFQAIKGKYGPKGWHALQREFARFESSLIRILILRKNNHGADCGQMDIQFVPPAISEAAHLTY
jgi:hypothetical protein